jgi:4-diphosphocytidyl-2-C-methyl-D-erythritol kinase
MRELALRALAPAKINLGLFIGPTRADGKHELVTVMQSISLADELTLRAAPDGAAGDEVICPGVSAENLAASALRAFREATDWDAPPLRLCISKRIPLAGGLAGGSVDAAAALRLAIEASGLGDMQLALELASGLGADVPAALSPGRWLASGAGERLSELPDPNPSFGVLLLPADGELSTAAVYAQADRMGLARTPKELTDYHAALQSALGFGASTPAVRLLGNDLQLAAMELRPEIKERLGLVEETGADVTFLSGSGPTVVGLFTRANGLVRAQRAARALALCEPAPLACEPVGGGFAAVHSVGTSQLGEA